MPRSRTERKPPSSAAPFSIHSLNVRRSTDEGNQTLIQTASDATSSRITELFNEHQQDICKRTDHMFAVLMTLQWVAGIVAAYWISPRTWIGATSQTHIHVWAALFLGGAISSLPIILALTRPGRSSTRYTIAVGQMLMGALAHPSHGRPHRNAFPRFWFAGLPLVLP